MSATDTEDVGVQRMLDVSPVQQQTKLGISLNSNTEGIGVQRVLDELPSLANGLRQ